MVTAYIQAAESLSPGLPSSPSEFSFFCNTLDPNKWALLQQVLGFAQKGQKEPIWQERRGERGNPEQEQTDRPGLHTEPNEAQK